VTTDPVASTITSEVEDLIKSDISAEEKEKAVQDIEQILQEYMTDYKTAMNNTLIEIMEGTNETRSSGTDKNI
jgi:hypothetical protein